MKRSRKRSAKVPVMQCIPWCHLWLFLDHESHMNLMFVSKDQTIRNLFIQSKRWLFHHVPMFATKVSLPCCVKTHEIPTIRDIKFHFCGNYCCHNQDLLVVPEGVVKFDCSDIRDSRGFGFNRQMTFPSSLTSLQLSYEFNKPITPPPNLVRLCFGDKFNQELSLPCNLRVLHLGDYFNKPLTLPESLTDLELGYKFRQPIILTSNLTRLCLGWKFNH